MKKLIAFTFSIFFSLGVFAQKPVAGDNQITLGIHGSNSGYLLLRHYYRDDLARRYAIGGNQISYSNNPSGTSYGRHFKSNSFSMNSFISYGIQKSFMGFEKIEPYIGIDYSLNINASKGYSKSEVIDTTITGPDTYGDYRLTRDESLTLRLNLKPVVGFNYYISHNFAIGIEYSLNLFYIGYAFGSNFTDEGRTNGIPLVPRNYQSGPTFNIGSNFTDNLVITATYCFGHKKKDTNKRNEHTE